MVKPTYIEITPNPKNPCKVTVDYYDASTSSGKRHVLKQIKAECSQPEPLEGFRYKRVDKKFESKKHPSGTRAHHMLYAVFYDNKEHFHTDLLVTDYALVDPANPLLKTAKTGLLAIIGRCIDDVGKVNQSEDDKFDFIEGLILFEKLRPAIISVIDLYIKRHPARKFVRVYEAPYDEQIIKSSYNYGLNLTNYLRAPVTPHRGQFTSPQILPKYRVTITNPTRKTKRAVIFGFNQFFTKAHKNFGSDRRVSVECSYSNVEYFELLAQSAFNPFKISKIRVSSSNNTQVKNPIQYISKDADGSFSYQPINPKHYFSEEQHQKGVIDIPIRIEIDSNRRLEVDILPKSKVVFTFFVKKEPIPIKSVVGTPSLEPITERNIDTDMTGDYQTPEDDPTNPA